MIMAYKDPEYMKKWRAANKELTRRYNKGDYKKRSKSKSFKNKKRLQATETYHRSPAKRRAQLLLKNYGITPQGYIEMLAAQNGGCAICHVSVPGPHVRHFAVDHDHLTGVVRGLLCSPCNLALGLFRDSCPILEQALAYLKKNRPS